MKQVLLIGLLILFLVASSLQDCADRFYKCYDADDNFLGVTCQGACWDWGSFECLKCFSNQFYIDECRKLFPDAADFSLSDSTC